MKKSRVVLLCLIMTVLVNATVWGDDRIEFRLNLGRQQEIVYRTRAEQKITQTVMGMEQKMDQIIQYDYRLSVKDVAADGTMRIDVTSEGCYFRQKALLGVTEYDSAKDEEAPAAVAALAAMIGTSYTMWVAPDGRTVKVDGVEEMLQTILDNMKLPAGVERDQMEEALRKQYSDDTLADTLSGAVSFYPDGPVGIGDSWTKETSAVGTVPISAENTWTLRSRQNGLAVIDIQSTIKADPNALPMENAGMTFYYALSGEQTGTMEVDETTGWPLTSRLVQSISGTVEIVGIGGAEESISCPISIQGTITTELLEQ